MPAQIPINYILDKTLEGIAQAQKDYAKWTDGDWLWNAPEYLLSTFIAHNISKIKGAKYLTLENSAKSAIEDAGARGKGRLHSKMRANGRFDILLWWGSYDPRAVIEVKNQINNADAIRNDLLRIKEVLKRKRNDSSFQFGIVAYYTSTIDSREFSARERINKRIKKIFEDAKNIVGEEFRVKPFNKRVQVEDDSAWVAAALLIM
jgi:hypothetical protein